MQVQCSQLADGHQWKQVYTEFVLQYGKWYGQVQRQHQQHDLEGW